jgi:hypothetical protein
MWVCTSPEDWRVRTAAFSIVQPNSHDQSDRVFATRDTRRLPVSSQCSVRATDPNIVELGRVRRQRLDAMESRVNVGVDRTPLTEGTV